MADWIIVVDDDTSNLKMAGHILSKMLNLKVEATRDKLTGFLNKMSGKNGDESSIRRLHPEFMPQYEALLRTINRALGKEQAPAGSSGDDEILEFAPDTDDEVLEFAPEEGS